MQKKTVHITIIIFLSFIIFEKNINRYISILYTGVTHFFYEYIQLIKNKNNIYKITMEYYKMKKKLIENKFLESEVKFYKQFINNNNTYNKNLVLCQVINIINTKQEKFIIINKGKNDGILQDMVVITNENVILGRICYIYDYFSIVKLLDNEDQYIAGIIDNKVEFMLKGCRLIEDGHMVSIAVDNKKNLIFSNDSIVYTSGKGLIYPPGYIIGILKNNSSYSSHCLQYKVQNSYNLNTLQYCFIIFESNHKKNIDFIMKYYKELLKKDF